MLWLPVILQVSVASENSSLRVKTRLIGRIHPTGSIDGEVRRLLLVITPVQPFFSLALAVFSTERG